MIKRLALEGFSKLCVEMLWADPLPSAPIEQVEEGAELAPKFDDRGLIPAV